MHVLLTLFYTVFGLCALTWKLWQQNNQTKPCFGKHEKVNVKTRVGNLLLGLPRMYLFHSSSTRAKFCQLLASLSAILPYLNLTKLKLEYLKSGFKCKKER